MRQTDRSGAARRPSARAALTTAWRPAADPAARVYVFPHAGAGAAAVRPLALAAPDWLEVVAVRLPGREGRLREPAPADLAEAVDAVAAAALTAGHLDRPLVWLGACAGSVLAFEAARRTARPDRATGLVVTSREAPSVPLPPSPADDAAIVRELTALGGLDPELLASPEALDLLLPAVRADQRLVDGYLHPAEPRLDLPLLAVRGHDDPLLTTADLTRWQQHTRAPSRTAELPGGHFLLTDSPHALAAEVASFTAALLPA